MDGISRQMDEERWARMSDSERKREYLSLCRLVQSFVRELPEWMNRLTLPENDSGRSVRPPASLHREAAMSRDSEYVFVWEGAVWFVRFQNEEGWVRSLVGILYIAILLDNQRVRYTPVTLATTCGRFNGPVPGPRIFSLDDGVELGQAGFGRQPKSDQRTIREVRHALEELAVHHTDSPSENLALKDTLKAYEARLGEAVALSERKRCFQQKPRGVPDANTNGKAISDALKEIRRCGLPQLERHLRRSIQPYANPISYLPEDRQISWYVRLPQLPTSKVGRQPLK